jgi:hypothetical protein
VTPTLDFGPVTLSWLLDESDPRWQGFLTAYGPYFAGGTGQLTIEAVIDRPAAGREHPTLPSSFIRARQVNGRSFTLGEKLVCGNTVSEDRISCTIHPMLLSGCGLRVLEQFLYLLFYHVALASSPDEQSHPFLLHSSGVLHRNGVHVFCGPSGSGKSTAASLCPARPLLSDEALVFCPESGSMTVIASPINPFCQEASPGQGRLAKLYLIEHGPDHTLSPISRAEAVPRLTAEVIAPLGLYEQDLAVGMARALDRALLLHSTGQVRRLRFRPDPGFWNLLT